MKEYEVIGIVSGGSAEGIVSKFLDVCEGKRLITVSSEAPHEGKSTVVLSLAYALSEYGKSVIVIDADFRTMRGIAHHFGMKSHHYDDKTYMDMAHNVGGYKVVYPKDYGKTPESIINSERFGNFLDEAKREYEIVLIDTPPYAVFRDAEVIASKTDGVVLVRSDRVYHTHTVTNVLGVIENQFRGRRGIKWRMM